MGRMMQKIFLFFLALAVALAFPITALAADGTVTIKAPGILTFGPGSAFTETDLFDGFKDVMPGDTLSQHIDITNNWYQYESIRVYLRAEPHGRTNAPLSGVAAEDSNALLSQLSMTVTRSRDDKQIFHASPKELDGLRGNVLLATLSRGKSTGLDVQLKVPITLGNDYANRVGEVDWVFTIEGEPGKGEGPKTGDFWLPWAVGIMLLSGAALAVMLGLGSRRRRE